MSWTLTPRGDVRCGQKHEHAQTQTEEWSVEGKKGQGEQMSEEMNC